MGAVYLFLVTSCAVLEAVFANTMDVDGKRAKDQAMKDAARQQKEDAFKSKAHGGKGPKDLSALEPLSQETVQEARALAKMQLERAACDYAAMDALEKEAAE